MIRISFNLPTKYRLELKLIKRRVNLDEQPFLPDLGKVLRAKKGNKLSRFFRLFFENEKIKKVLGTNLAILAIATSILPTHQVSFSEKEEVLIEPPTVIATEKGLQYPLDKVKVTQGYKFFHPGIDFDGITGDTVHPIMTGVVSKIEYSRFGYGKSVIVSHGSATKSLYAHVSKIEVAEGQEVTKDTKIGEVGSTGRAFGDHLHLEVYEDGKSINPMAILP